MSSLFKLFPQFATQSRFPHFRALKPCLHKPTLTYHHDGRPFTFMRWKEKFVVPDHKAALDGASFAGFYYIAVDWSRQREPPREPSRRLSQSHPPMPRRSSSSSAVATRRLSYPSLVAPSSPTYATRALTGSTPRAVSFSQIASSGSASPRFSYAAAVRGSSPHSRTAATSQQDTTASPSSRSAFPPPPSSSSSSTSAASPPIPIPGAPRSPLSVFPSLPPENDSPAAEAEDSESVAKADENGGSSALSLVDDDEFPLPGAAASSSSPVAPLSVLPPPSDERKRRTSSTSRSPCREREVGVDDGLGYRGPWQGATMTGF
jgi:hypothetical protein